jgi:preprotein translocase subunit SecA
MLQKIISTLIGTPSDRVIKRYNSELINIPSLEEEMKILSDQEIKDRSDNLRKNYSEKNDNSEFIAEGISIVREVAERTVKLRPFDTQILGALALYKGNIAEMGTGEGKTLVAVLACYLNVVKGDKVHVVTVNDYLAMRDSEFAREILEFLNITVGCNVSGLTDDEKKVIYSSDVIYGTNSEFGFDYLKDNLISNPENKLQTGLEYCLIDEVDSILIDEARTPLVISGSIEGSSDMYVELSQVISKLDEKFVTISEKDNSVQLNEDGFIEIEEMLRDKGILEEGKGLFASESLHIMHCLNATLRAYFVIKKDVDYLIKNSEILIIDEYTGRAMEGRRWSNGIHQALEAKEGLDIQPENETIASITYQNYFRIYKTLSGMTGTANTEATEFLDIYGLNVVCIPPNKPTKRNDQNDRMYPSKEAKYRAIIEDIKATNKIGQPLLIGTPSVEISEEISNRLKKVKIKFNLLNAKNHKLEAKIISEAGCVGAITIATNMAGRGTDIKLGKSQQEKEDIIKRGGLRVIGVERQDNRRLDNQLRGRSGRQGDPGSSCFYVSPEDSLLRKFGGDRMKSIMDTLIDGDELIEHSLLNRAVTNSQKKLEGSHYDARKQIVKYDNVTNSQRENIYSIRNKILKLNKDTLDNYFNKLSLPVFEDFIASFGQDTFKDSFSIKKKVLEKYGLDVVEGADADKINEAFLKILKEINLMANETVIDVKKGIMLQALDFNWIRHIANSDELRRGVGLRGYAQKDPIKEYENESFQSFESLLIKFSETIVNEIIRLYKEGSEKTRPQENNSGWLISDALLGDAG